MTDYPRSAYGSNPLGYVNPNASNGWPPGEQWPNGVPASKIGVATYKGIRSYVRIELVELDYLTMRLAYEKHGYTLVPGWCWSYENRPIGGTSIPSNHSKGRARDWNAPANGQGYTFQCDIPPGLIADLAELGYYSGVYYTGQYDPMHTEYVFSPDRVAQSVARAKQMLGDSVPKPTPVPAAVAQPFQLPKGVGYAKAGVKLGGYSRLVNGTNSVTSKANIQRMQRALTRRGFTVSADGIFGAATEAAVKKFQKSTKGKVTVSGVVGPKTWKLIGVTE